MLPKIKPQRTEVWKKLNTHFKKIKDSEIRDLFAEDPDRFQRFSLKMEDILVDFSKNRINSKTLSLLEELAMQCELKAAIEAMFTGEAINETEGRAVLHTALRNFFRQAGYCSRQECNARCAARAETDAGFLRQST